MCGDSHDSSPARKKVTPDFRFENAVAIYMCAHSPERTPVPSFNHKLHCNRFIRFIERAETLHLETDQRLSFCLLSQPRTCAACSDNHIFAFSSMHHFYIVSLSTQKTIHCYSSKVGDKLLVLSLCFWKYLEGLRSFRIASIFLRAKALGQTIHISKHPSRLKLQHRTITLLLRDFFPYSKQRQRL